MKHISGQGPLYIRAMETLTFEKNEDGDHDHSPVLHNNDYNDIRDYMEGHTLLPITTVYDVDAKPGPGSRHRDAVSTSGSLQVDTGSCEVQSSSSVAYQNSAQLKPSQGSSSRNEDTMPAIIQCEISNKLSEERKVQVLNEMFPDLNEDKLKQALECANSDLTLAINKVLEDTTFCPSADQVADDNKDDWLWETPLAVAHSAIIDIDDVAHCLIAFAKEAMKPIGCDLELEVDRNTDLLKQMLRKYKNPGFDITKHLSIEFKDEMGLDAGGVTREYFHLLMERLKQGPGGAINLFEGQLGHLVPIHNYDVLSGGLFVLAGKMILHSILNDCNGVPGMSPAIISYLMTGR
ncbi:uncharacterized protein LOC122960892 [Acropora millepora]|uniref:uncharacterized protein LOC122960892 n=1 Tax=Acropora millepora TaxID=45264 RepID=UPI001CF5F719|nr:uncharacterized protein LOC122960892 [Acropora millepora]